jgi:hypothetical protein
MNNHTNNVQERVFYTYKSENKAIYVSPICSNFGYILPISNQIVSSNTFTFIYRQKPSCEMFIAPISLRKQFSKTFVSYKKYDKKLKEHLRNKRSRSYIDITEIPGESIGLKKSRSYQDLRKYKGFERCSGAFLNDVDENNEDGVQISLDGLSKIIKIFDIQPSDTNCNSELEPLADYFFGASSEDFMYDDQ